MLVRVSSTESSHLGVVCLIVFELIYIFKNKCLKFITMDTGHKNNVCFWQQTQFKWEISNDKTLKCAASWHYESVLFPYF